MVTGIEIKVIKEWDKIVEMTGNECKKGENAETEIEMNAKLALVIAMNNFKMKEVIIMQHTIKEDQMLNIILALGEKTAASNDNKHLSSLGVKDKKEYNLKLESNGVMDKSTNVGIDFKRYYLLDDIDAVSQNADLRRLEYCSFSSGPSKGQNYERDGCN